MINANRDQLRHSAQTKKDAASELMRGNRLHPVPAVYLSHVALECALKRRILLKNGVKHIDDLKRLLPGTIVDALFRGTKGHDLHHLAGTAHLRKYLAVYGNRSLLDQPEWQTMAGDRPYSLRYGIETVETGEAKKQVQFAISLADLILKEAL